MCRRRQMQVARSVTVLRVGSRRVDLRLAHLRQHPQIRASLGPQLAAAIRVRWSSASARRGRQLRAGRSLSSGCVLARTDRTRQAQSTHTAR